MNLKNGYKTLYEVLEVKDNETYRIFKASRSGLITDAETILSVKSGDYKLIYQLGDKIYGSTESIPTNNDHEFSELNKLFIESTDEMIDEMAEDSNEEDEIEPANQSEEEDMDNLVDNTELNEEV